MSFLKKLFGNKDEERRREEARKAEEDRRAQEERAAQERRRQEERLRRAQEALRAEEARKAEESRRAEEAGKVGQARSEAAEIRQADAENTPGKPVRSAADRTATAGSRPPMRPRGPIGGDLTMQSIHRLGTKVLVDASAAASEGFAAFAEAFRTSRPQPNRFLFMADFSIAALGEKAAPVEKLVASRLVIRWEGSADYPALFEKRASFAPFLVVVNDMKAASDIHQAASAAQAPVRLVQLNVDGSLRPMLLPSRQGRGRTGEVEQMAADAFAISTAFARFQFARLTREPLGVGSTVYTGSGEAIRLGAEVTHNENSITYAIHGSDRMAKIFSANKLTTLEMNKCQRMLEKKIDFPGLCWPLEMLRDAKGTFVGFTTGAFRGKPLNQCVMQPGALAESFPKWTKVEIGCLARTVMEKISYMHTHGILFGSIEPASILVHSETEVYFLDTDRYQIEGFPCMKYSYAFCAPEALDKADKIHLTTLAEERFAVAELAFALIMPGKTSYPSGSTGDALQNIRSMRFPYSWGKNRGAVDENNRIGQWRYVWSHLSPELKECFYKTFMNGRLLFQPAQRIPASRWKTLFDDFVKELNAPDLYDRSSRLVFPPSFKRTPQETFLRCGECGVEHPEWYFRKDFLDAGRRMCRPCTRMPSEEGFTCKHCGKSFIYTRGTALFHQLRQESGEWKKQKYCRYCKNKKATCRDCGEQKSVVYIRDDGRCGDCHEKWRNAPATYVNCRDCCQRFPVTNGEMDFLRSKGMNLPTRCKACRERRKNKY